MKRPLYLLPLMAATALSLSLAACDDKKDNQPPAEQVTIEETTDAAPIEEAPAEALAAQVAASSATAYATAEGATTGAVFLSLQNTGTQPAKLIGASSDASSSVEIHEAITDPETGTTQMRPVDGVDIQVGQQIDLRPDGYHLMLIGLNKTLIAGETLSLTLRFDNAPEVVIPVSITAPGDADETHNHVTPPADGSSILPPATEGTTEEVTPAPTTVDETSVAPLENDADANSVTADAPATADESVE